MFGPRSRSPPATIEPVTDDAATQTGPAASSTAVFRKPDFALLWTAQLVSTAGSSLTALAAGILVTLTRSPAPQDPLGELTERGSEILKLVVQGLTNREIGERLHLSEKTIKHYITNILEKLHVRSRMEAAMLAVRGGRQDSQK